MRSYTSYVALNSNEELYRKVQFALNIVASEMVKATPEENQMTAFSKREQKGLSILNGFDQIPQTVRLVLVENDQISDLSDDADIIEAVRGCYDILANVTYNDLHQ